MKKHCVFTFFRGRDRKTVNGQALKVRFSKAMPANDENELEVSSKTICSS
jgi:hypothetical protein